jgi:hypothetical protein
MNIDLLKYSCIIFTAISLFENTKRGNMEFNMPVWMRTVLADNSRIALELPGSAVDQIHAVLEHHGYLPRSRIGQLTLAQLILMLNAFADQQYGPGHFPQYVHSVLGGLAPEIARRIISARQQLVILKPLGTAPQETSASTWDAMTDAVEKARGHVRNFRRLA